MFRNSSLEGNCEIKHKEFIKMLLWKLNLRDFQKISVVGEVVWKIMLAQPTFQTGIGFSEGVRSLTRSGWNNFYFQTVSLLTQTNFTWLNKDFCSKTKSVKTSLEGVVWPEKPLNAIRTQFDYFWRLRMIRLQQIQQRHTQMTQRWHWPSHPLHGCQFSSSNRASRRSKLSIRRILPCFPPVNSADLWHKCRNKCSIYNF